MCARCRSGASRRTTWARSGSVAPSSSRDGAGAPRSSRSRARSLRVPPPGRAPLRPHPDPDARGRRADGRGGPVRRDPRRRRRLGGGRRAVHQHRMAAERRLRPDRGRPLLPRRLHAAGDRYRGVDGQGARAGRRCLARLRRRTTGGAHSARPIPGPDITTTGDGFVALFDGAERAIRAALGICRAASELGIEVRTGVHTGEAEMEGDNVRGVAVHIAARITGLAGPGEVDASWATREPLAGSSIGFTDRGAHALKGLSEERRVYAVEISGDRAPLFAVGH